MQPCTGCLIQGQFSIMILLHTGQARQDDCQCCLALLFSSFAFCHSATCKLIVFQILLPRLETYCFHHCKLLSHSQYMFCHCHCDSGTNTLHFATMIHQQCHCCQTFSRSHDIQQCHHQNTASRCHPAPLDARGGGSTKLHAVPPINHAIQTPSSRCEGSWSLILHTTPLPSMMSCKHLLWMQGELAANDKK